MFINKMILFQLILLILLLSSSSSSSSTPSSTSSSSSSLSSSSSSYLSMMMKNLMNNIITITNTYISFNSNINDDNDDNSIDNDKSDSIVYHEWGNNNNNDTPENIATRDRLKRLLFPNITIGGYHLGGYHDYNDENGLHGRQLAPIVKPKYDPANTVCLKCSGMDKCSILEGLLIMEVYLPNNPEERGTCNVIEALGRRIFKEIFGNGKTFRDTVQCKDIVMQYLCLFWGSENQMYTNYCINQEDYTSVNPLFHKISPRPPCRSFCVQLADVCANDPGFINICNEIACPPTEDKCVPDPKINGQSLAASIGCDMPFFYDPYAPKNEGGSYRKINYLLLLLSIMLSMWITN